MKKILLGLMFLLMGCGDETTIINNQETSVMINLSSIFQEANNQPEKERDVLVMVEDVTLFTEKTTESDWGNNVSESNMDYTSSPPNAGDVVLTTNITPDEEQLISNTQFHLVFPTTESEAWQSFKQINGFAAILDQVSTYHRLATPSAPVNTTISCEIWSSNKTTKISSTQTFYKAISTTFEDYWAIFDFSEDNLFLENNIEYWIKITAIISNPNDLSSVWYQNTDVYGNGQMDGYFPIPDSWNYDIGDMAFEIKMNDNYNAVGDITTDNIDIGEIPTDLGEWVLEDVTPDNSTLTYEAWYSTTGVFGGEEVSIGAIIDGQVITDLKRYWRVKASFAANTNRNESPTLQSIKADYTTYRKFNKIPDLGYEPLVASLSSLTSKVDFFKPASIGQISVGIQMTDAVSDWVYSDTLYNKIVQVKLGFKYDGFAESDYIHYFTGAIDDWTVNDGILNLTLKDLSKEWKLPVPSKWEDAGDNVTYTDEHHTDVMLDIFQNHINVRDSGLLLDSFATVKAATSGYQVTRTITGNTIDAKKLVEELRVLLMAFFLPRGDGKVGIKQFDAAEAIVVTFTDDNTTGIKWRANSKDLINRTSLYFDWNGDGEKEADFLEYDPGDNGTSQTKFQEIRPYILKDKWTDVAEATQISDLETKILAQFDDMPSRVTITCDAKDIAYEAGDMVGVTTLESPGNNGAGITDEKYLITSKNLDFLGDKIVFEGLKVAI